jgi:predicted flap endonuclease-1-like 5' DNA nuclease
MVYFYRITHKGGETYMATISDIEGIGRTQAKKLQEAGVNTVEALLEAGATATQRKHLSEAAGVTETQLLEWVNRADLFRIKGIGSEFSDLLEAAGVDSVPELKERNPENLFNALTELNDKKRIVRQVPSLAQITDFITQAGNLPKVVTH